MASALPWDKIAGGAFGLAAGLASPNPYGGTAYDMPVDKSGVRDIFGNAVSRNEGWASGSKPIQTQGTINRLTSGSLARLGSAAAGAKENATERWAEGGQGPHAGSLDRRLAEIDRSLIDATRQQQAPLLGQMAQREPEFQMQAQQALTGIGENLNAMSYADWQRMEKLKAAKKAAGSPLYRGLAGAMVGLGGNYGGGGGSGGGGGQQAGGG